MSTHIADNPGTPRKDHKCRVCNELTPKGSKCHISRYVDTEGFYTLYFHTECWTYAQKWKTEDWECIAPGDISRKDVLANYKIFPEL